MVTTAPLSTASTTATTPQNAPSLSLADLTPPSTDPNITINETNQSGRLQYPNDLPPYYFQIDLAKYDRKSWASAGAVKTQISIVLPMPQMLVDSQQIEWDTVPLGMTGVAAMNVARNNFPGENLQQKVDNAAAQLAGAGAATVLNNTDTIGKGFLAAGGIAVNQFLTLMLKGPSYRELDFSWTFSPQNATESARINSIIALINDAAAPSLLGATSAFFGYPYIFQCSFHFNGAPLGETKDGPAMIFNFKPAVVKNRVWNYTGAGQPAFFAPTRAPALITFSLKLIELEFWLAGQYGSGLATQQGTAITQSTIALFQSVYQKGITAAKDINLGLQNPTDGTGTQPTPPL